MNPARFQGIAAKYPRLRIAVVGDFSLDRYLEIDPARKENSLETNLPVYNVVNVRSQPGAAGTILNNLVALGIGTICPVGFCGNDGEGFELRAALSAKAGVQLASFFSTPHRRTFTYCKPLIMEPGKPPIELNRLDSKNWTLTPAGVQGQIIDAVQKLATEVDAMILMDQVDTPDTGVVTTKVLQAINSIIMTRPEFLVLADSRRGLRGYPPVTLKMNAAELTALTDAKGQLTLQEIKETAVALSRRQGRNVFVTLAEHGILGASPDGAVEHVPALPVRSEIDIVGAGDSVTANLTAALTADATLREALEIANAAASVVIHQLGTTGTASTDEIEKRLSSGMS